MKQKKTNRFDIRLTEKDYNRVKLLANMYAGGNINLWLTHGGLNAPRIFLGKSDIKSWILENFLEESKESNDICDKYSKKYISEIKSYRNQKKRKK